MKPTFFLFSIFLSKVFSSLEDNLTFLSETCLVETQNHLQTVELSLLQLLHTDDQENASSTVIDSKEHKDVESIRKEISLVTDLRKINLLLKRLYVSFAQEEFYLSKKCTTIMQLGYKAKPLIFVKGLMSDHITQGKTDKKFDKTLLKQFDTKTNQEIILEKFADPIKEFKFKENRNLSDDAVIISLAVDFLVSIIQSTLESIETLNVLISRPIVVQERALRRQVEKFRIFELEKELKPLLVTLQLYKTKIEELKKSHTQVVTSNK